MSELEPDHWSIGEVLTQVQADFPDVTISKIRFLESQGLISPERTPSGYRRFYPQDLERLQWILSQQRDHYLPLKVIRDRLESGDLEGLNEVDTSPVLPFGGEETAAERKPPRTGRPLPKPDDGAEELRDTSAGVGLADGTPSVLVDLQLADEPTAEVEHQVAPEPGSSSEPAVQAANAPTPDAEIPDEAGSSSIPRMERRGRDRDRGTKDDRRSATTGASPAMTKDELAEASGCTVETLIELERFGLLHGRTIGPTVLFDSEALRVATLAAGFVELGLEPRHLRTFKIDAEREVSLLSQVVEPLFYRRDQRARNESLESLDRLVQLSADLREILVRQMVREQLPSQRG